MPNKYMPDYKLAKQKVLEYEQIRSYVLDDFLVSEISADVVVGFPEEDRDEMLGLFGRMAQRIYRYKDAQSYWRQIVKYAGAVKDYKRQVDGLLSLYDNTWRSDPVQAFEILNATYDLCKDHVENMLPRVLHEIGFNYARFQDYVEAINYYQKALSQINEDEHDVLHGTILNNLGYAYLRTGRMAKAKAHIEAGRRLRQRIYSDVVLAGDVTKIAPSEMRVAYSYVILGTLARYSNDLTSAEDNYTYAISIFERHNDQSARANALLNRGETYRRLARLNFENDQPATVELNERKSYDDIQTGKALCHQYGLLNLLDTAYRREGRLLHDQGYRAVDDNVKLDFYDQALVKFENALEIAVQTSDVVEELENLREIAFLADDHADIVVQSKNREIEIQEEYQKLERYIARFEDGLKRHEKDRYRLYSYEAFDALLTLEKAAFSYSRGNRDEALNLYIQAFINLAKQPGYGVSNYLIYLPHLFKNIRKLNNPDLEKKWCGKIKAKWEEQGLDRVREEMIANIEVHMLELGG